LAKRRGPYCQEEEIDEYTRIFRLSGAGVALMQGGRCLRLSFLN
jgi:hypothetical protein